MKAINDAITVSKPLLDKLKEAYPDRMPLDRISLEEFRYLQGQQSVLNYVQMLYDEALKEN
jgi:hypothetical protein